MCLDELSPAASLPAEDYPILNNAAKRGERMPDAMVSKHGKEVAVLVEGLEVTGPGKHMERARGAGGKDSVSLVEFNRSRRATGRVETLLGLEGPADEFRLGGGRNRGNLRNG